MARSAGSLDNLANLNLEALKALWSKAFGSRAPAGAKRELLIRLLAHGLQGTAQVSVSRAALKLLRSAASPTNGNPSQIKLLVDGAATLRLGSRLVRSWNGAAHEVTVLDRGFAYRGKQYRSLSEIAQLITGAHWSGPRFFGLKKVRSSKVAAARAST